MKIDQYLQRIGVDEIIAINLEYLKQLQFRHMLHIPFENLDVICHVPIPLDVETYYEKVVLNHRGGFCYELNGLFYWLLQNLGFKSRLVSGTINRPDGSWALAGSHACLIVEIDQPYLVDVGFGDSARTPLPLTGETREDVSGIYRVVKVKENIYDLQRQKDSYEWDTLYRIDSRPKKLTAFAEACHFNQTSPKSHFTQREIVSIGTMDGRITLSGNSLTITNNGKKEKVPVSVAEKTSILEKYFQIRLN
ncbi:N-hydroxyarylamine O-acetyltransferase [Scopulibacillus darangshiensis]|uniref:N-hydroxyarylamine O-acetyltransferase n=1 Tax=Scopulibacillus darangshiensis TaxID=442528 RepID=A0A4V2SNJ7_9BACL|nr:arylamine N-acetyltransferase [Scopulibacillus darangshiensis]TCP31516.1 N-hydroxyarylamine O-acetyltransferase [Scopulibacillus darangshiensis]